MRLNRKTTLATGFLTALAAGCAAVAAQELTEQSAAETKPPFSGEANVAYAEALWGALEEARLVGPDAIVTYPYEGQTPHGKVLEYLETDLTLEGHTDVVLVKKNYAGEGEVEELEHAILDDRMTYLDSVTVMYRREAGYDPDNHDWFWAKYQPDGSLATNPKDMQLAGRVAKGANAGCIACHKIAEGDDYVYSHDKFAE